MDWEAVEVVCSGEFWRMAVLWTLSLLYSYVLLALERTLSFLPGGPRPRSYPRSLPGSPTGTCKPVCVITGATSGLGAAAARSLAAKGYCVVLVGRSPHLLSKIIEEIMEQLKDAQLKDFLVDLSSIHSIMKFRVSLEKWLSDSNLHPSVQLLVNNAGILAMSRRVTSDGYDQMMETNFLGAFALTNLLLPLLKSSPLPSRIVNVTSFTHRCVSPVQVSVIAADPGAVETKIMREVPRHLSGLAFTVLRHFYLSSTPENGVGSIIDAALAPAEASGLYFFGGRGRTIKSSPLSYDEKLAEELWFHASKLFQEAQTKITVEGDFLPW